MSDIQTSKNCFSCKFSAMFIKGVKHIGNNEFAEMKGICKKDKGRNYPIFVPNAGCKDWRKCDNVQMSNLQE